MTDYLADACALIVFLAEPNPDSIMPRAAPIMRTQAIAVSPITVWEITRKIALGKLPPLGTGTTLPALLAAQGFEVQNFTWEDAAYANLLPAHHKDPMDRILIAQALRHDMTIVTDDGVFGGYGVKTVW